MPKKNKEVHGHRLPVLIGLLALIDFGLFIKYLLHDKNIALFNSKGYIAEQEHGLMVFVVAALLVVIVPTLIMFYFVAWKYRESNTKAVHDPNLRYRKSFDVTIWTIPFVVMIVLVSVMWPATHRLAPQKLIAANVKPLTIEVVSMRWKWLFIYPDQKIATVNFVQIPIDTPVQFALTADDAPMSSFWIPNLSGMLYSMTGMVNHLNMIADTPGDFPGSSAEISGAGFAGMKFTARVSTSDDFNVWVNTAQQSPDKLDDGTYANLLKPSENNPLAIYATADDSLYDKVVMKYMEPSTGAMQEEMHHE